ncbi:conserved protein, unknown function [Hepatocystis sp. ex Piliocolobus tephrosceles]|nr:conserved protein, unknown function [Hepatocystis sp. ex Piliocolobus tephrosceles]
MYVCFIKNIVKKMQDRNDNYEYDDNFEMFIKQFVSELKKKDKYKNGLITHETFIEVMDIFEIEYGSSIMNYLMQHCIVNEEGYVNYKKLLLIHDPSKTLKNNSNHVEDVMNPECMYRQIKYENSDQYKPKKSDIIRQLYAHWDKCLLTDEEFKTMLINEDVKLTPEFERSLYLYGPSRSLSFVNVMKTLFINDCTQRKNRNNTIINNKEYGNYKKKNIDEHIQSSQPMQRNPLAWVEENVNNTDDIIEDVNIISNYFAKNENSAIDKNIMLTDFFNVTVKNLIKIYITNNIPQEEFINCLNKMNIVVTSDLNNLIKHHELDSNGKFKDFTTTINRSISNNMTL